MPIKRLHFSQPLFCCFFLFAFINVFGQNEINFGSGGDFDIGIAGKLNIELQSRDYQPNFKFSLTAGVGYRIEDIYAYPTIHSGLIMFNRGVIGSALNDKWSKIRTHFFVSTQANIQIDRRDLSINDRYFPLYHFSDFTANPLQNPYKSSISLGAIWMGLEKNLHQRIGFLNLSVAGRIQLSYYNDGGPVLGLFGDKLDRYYTGGVVLSYHDDYSANINLLEVSYHKFTGYQKHAFDVATALQMDYVVYADANQFAFNHQRWRINFADLNSGFSAHASIYDYNAIDLQDAIHLNTNVPYHPDYYRKWRFAFGGRYEYNYLSLKE